MKALSLKSTTRVTLKRPVSSSAWRSDVLVRVTLYSHPGNHVDGFDTAGLADPPSNCPAGEFRASPDGSECVCKPGYYPSGLDCVACLPGHMCPNGTLVRCPLHYYQQATQATSCIRCGSTGDANGFFRCPRRGFQLQFCDPAKPETQNQDLAGLCVQCSQCKRGYASDDIAGLVGCYRDD